jgi:hypothetical protein
VIAWFLLSVDSWSRLLGVASTLCVAPVFAAVGASVWCTWAKVPESTVPTARVE